MNQELRNRLLEVRRRATKALDDCDNCDKEIAKINEHIAAMEAAAEQSPTIAAALADMKKIAESKIAEHEEAKCCFDDQFNDLLK